MRLHHVVCPSLLLLPPANDLSNHVHKHIAHVRTVCSLAHPADKVCALVWPTTAIHSTPCVRGACACAAAAAEDRRRGRAPPGQLLPGDRAAHGDRPVARAGARHCRQWLPLDAARAACRPRGAALHAQACRQHGPVDTKLSECCVWVCNKRRALGCVRSKKALAAPATHLTHDRAARPVTSSC